MRISRLFVDAPLAPDQRVELTDDAANYLGRVLRCRRGDAIVVFNGRGGEYAATVDVIEKRRVVIALGNFDATERESSVTSTLLQSAVRGDRMDYAIQKATELGVSRIVPLDTEFGEVRLGDSRREKRQRHWQGVAVAAAQQCGRTRVPEVCALTPLATAISAAPSDGTLRLVALPGSDNAWPEKHNIACQIAIGPEGGFSPDERELLAAHGFISLSLGPRVLRSETAAVTALALMQARYGDL